MSDKPIRVMPELLREFVRAIEDQTIDILEGNIGHDIGAYRMLHLIEQFRTDYGKENE